MPLKTVNFEWCEMDLTFYARWRKEDQEVQGTRVARPSEWTTAPEATFTVVRQWLDKEMIRRG